MAEEMVTTNIIEVQPEGVKHESSGGPMDIELPMMVLTWLTFIIMTAILYKLAWKPILRALKVREDTIRQSLEDAEKARVATAAADMKRKEVLDEARKAAQEIVWEAHTAAGQMALTIETKARNEARVLIEDARKEIFSATAKAREELRSETAELVVTLAGKILEKSMDSGSNKELVQKLIKEI